MKLKNKILVFTFDFFCRRQRKLWLILFPLYFVLCTLSFILLQSCNTTEPVDDGKPAPPDTTTQNFTFETYGFGDGFSSSYFNDVWIFNENNIIAVGFLSSSDTVIDGQHVYNTNIIRWNGEKWKILPYSGTSTGIYGIWAEDSSNIYYANGLVFKYEEGKYVTYDFTSLPFSPNQSVHKLWGSSESNIYGVGPNGTIVHFDGQKWAKIDFDTQWRFDDITGNSKTGVAYAVATGDGFETAIVEINNSITNLLYNEQGLTSYSIEMLNDAELLLSNSKVWKFNLANRKAVILHDPGSGYYLPLSAMVFQNDLYFFGNKLSSGEKMIHYNGARFKVFAMPQRDDVIYGGAHAINNLAIMTGFSHNKAYLVKVIRE